MKTEVYSWRVSTDVKTRLEREARRRNISVSAALDLAAREWLGNSAGDKDEEEEQLRVRQAAAKVIGALASGDPKRSQNVREAVRQRLRRQHGR